MENQDADAGRWERVEHLFIEAMDLDEDARDELLRGECGDDASLRAEVESLLEAHDGVGPVDDRKEEHRLGGRFPDRIGSYRIVRQLGEGGMGVVLLAVREAEGFEQTVALKIIRGRFVDPHVIRKFDDERRLLARLEHPGIARLIDGGVTEEGEPFCAMEYVEGEDLLTYCDRRRLSVAERVQLFVQVCEAVHAAHQQLIVHRDLKPSNILVTTEGRPKLLDFGIAKSLEGEGTAATQLWVTPAYASPEQVTGAPITVVTDVYALGVLLCELLCGSRPYRTSRVPAAQLSETISQTPPRRPSELAEKGLPGSAEEEVAARAAVEFAADQRGMTPGQLSKALKGDLDVVVLTALAKEPGRRYGSARRLADDLRRYLDGHPIEARPATVFYRMAKFVRRNQAASLAGVLFVAALAAGTGATIWQARQAGAARDQAQDEANRARQVTAIMTDLFRLGDPMQNVGDTIGVRQVLQEGARRVEREMADDPVLQATLFLEIARVYRNLGVLREASSLADRTVDLMGRNEPGSVEHADALAFRALLARDAGEGSAAVELLQEALALRGGLIPDADTVTADLLAALGWEVRAAGDYERAGELFRSAMEIQERDLAPGHAKIASSQLGLASTFHDQGAFDQSEALFLSAMQRGAGGRPDPVAAAAMINLGMIRRLREQYADAAPMVEAGRTMREALFPSSHPDRIEADEQWGATLIALGRFQEAEPLVESALERSILVLGEEHSRTRQLREALAGIDWTMSRYDRSLARLDSVVAAKIRAHGGDHAGVVYTLSAMGQLLAETGRLEEATARLEEALAMGERLGGTEGVYGALIRASMGLVAIRSNRLDEAERLIDHARRLAAENLRDDHRYTLEIERLAARLRLARGNAPGALALLDPVFEAESRVRPSPHPRRGETLLLRGEALVALGDRDAARRAFSDAEAEFTELPTSHPLRQEARRGLVALEAGGA